MSVSTKRPTEARAVRVDKKLRESQARLSDKSFTDFVRQHNARRAQTEGGQR